MRAGARSHASRVVRRISERVFPSRFAHRSRKAIFLSSRRKMQIFIFVFVFVLGFCLAILDPGLSALEKRGLAIAHRPNCLELRELLERARDRVHDLTEEADRAHAIDWPSVLDLRDLPQAAPSVQAGAEGLRGCDAGMILNPGHTSLPGLHRRAEGAETPDRQGDFTPRIPGGPVPAAGGWLDRLCYSGNRVCPLVREYEDVRHSIRVNADDDRGPSLRWMFFFLVHVVNNAPDARLRCSLRTFVFTHRLASIVLLDVGPQE